MERKRLQQQRIKQQQRFSVSQQDLTEAITRMKSHRRTMHNNIMNVASSSLLSCSIDGLTIPSVSQLIKAFEERAKSTPFVSVQDLTPTDNDVLSNRTESNYFQQMSTRIIKPKIVNNNNNISSSILDLINDNNQMHLEKIHQDQFTGDNEQETRKNEQIYQTLDNDRYKRDLPSSSSSSYYSVEINNNSSNNTTQMSTRTTDIDLLISKRHDQCFEEMLTKEVQLNNALADLISLSNNADISSSMFSSSRSLTSYSQRRRTSNANENTNSISASITLLNNLIENFDLDNEEHKNKNYKKNTNNHRNNQKNNNDEANPINMFWY